MRVLIAGGGTGGHFYPAFAVMEELRGHAGTELAYVGTRRGIEVRLLPSYEWVRFFPTCVCGLERGRPWQNVRALFVLLWALVEAATILLRFRPHVVIGMGGYASFPAVWLSSLLGRVAGIRTVIHEQNAVVGLANRILSRSADAVLLSYPGSRGCIPHAKRVVVTGNPIRRQFLGARRSTDLYRRFGLDPTRRTALVFGGSQGSRALTDAVLCAKREIGKMRGLQVLLVIGRAGDEEDVRAELAAAGVWNIGTTSYIERMGDAFALADLVVCRAGATTLAEVTSCGKAALVIPWEQAADGHQRRNAAYLQQQEACVIADEAVIAERGLGDLIGTMLTDTERLNRMARNSAHLGKRYAASRILGEIHALTGEART